MSRPSTMYATVDVLHCDTPDLKEAKAWRSWFPNSAS
jgi:hypothetical protein